jgi:hypothetical protein
MAADLITYATKDKTAEDETAVFTDANANEIKTVVNQHASEIDDAADAAAAAQSTATAAGVLAASTASSVAGTVETAVANVRPSMAQITTSSVLNVLPYLRTYTVSGVGTEVTLPTGISSAAPVWYLYAIQADVPLIMGGANVQIIAGPSIIPQGALAEIRRISVGDTNVIRYVVSLLHEPA